MYPATGVTTGDILLSDLPASISVDAGGFTGTLDVGSGSGEFYNNGADIFIDIDGTDWKLYDGPGNVIAVIGQCLITGDGNLTPGDDAVEDQFEPTYLISGIGDDPDVEVTRESLCVWSGVDLCGNTWYLTYALGGPIEVGLEYGWNVKTWSQTEGCEITESFLGEKTGSQNSPVGSYDGVYTGTISIP